MTISQPSVRHSADVSLIESALLASKAPSVRFGSGPLNSAAVLLRDSNPVDVSRLAGPSRLVTPGVVAESGIAEGGRSGLLAPIYEIIDIFRVPDFWKLLLMSILQNSAPYGLTVFVTGPSMSYIFNEQAALIGNLNCMIHPLVSCVFAPAFGRWSDRHDRRWAVMLLVCGMLMPGVSFMIFGITKRAYWVSYVIEWVAGPLRAGITGSPVLWALYSDKIPPAKRELGFCMVFCLPALWNLWWGPFNKYLLEQYHEHILRIFYGIYVTCFALTLLTVWSMKPCRPQLTEDSQRSESPVASESAGDMLRATYRLLRGNKQLLALCAALAFLTLADLAGGFNSMIIGFTLLNIWGDHRVEQQRFTYLTTTYPPVMAILWTIALGFIAKRCGSARTLLVWLPITCALFGSFSVLDSSHVGNSAMYLYAGSVSIVPMSCFPPLTALVTQVVPSNRVGEALGCVSSCKSLMAFAAPTIMTAVMGAMGSHLELYVWIFPTLAVIMFMAWPFIVYLACSVRAMDSSVTPQ